MSAGLKSWLARQAYTLVLRLGMPFYLWRVWRRGLEEPSYRAQWPQRLALYDSAYRAQWLAGRQADDGSVRPVLWLHAVSLGEARAAAPLIQALRAHTPSMRLLLTHTTATGREAGQALLQSGDVQTWLPYDVPSALQRFLRWHRPSVGVLMETEVWPNVQHQAQQLGVPMVLANARLSAKSLKQGMRFAALMRPAARAMRVSLAQTHDDAERLRQMGAESVQVCGNVKFDMNPDEAQLARGRQWRQASDRPIVMAASTREGEEAPLLAAWLAWRTQWPASHASGSDPSAQAPRPWPRLLIVPRHPQRFDEVAHAVSQCGMSLSRRSAWRDGPDATALQSDVWLGDSMGEMAQYYACADAALLGGSFAPLGGQNLIEAASCGCPVVMGPSTFNFADAAQGSEDAGAAFRVKDWDEGVAQAVRLTEPSRHAQAQQAAWDFAAAHRGAAQTMAQAIWSVAR